MSADSRAARGRVSAAIVAEWRVVGEATVRALGERSVDATLLDWPPQNGRVRNLRRRVNAATAQVAVALCDLDRPARLHTVEMIVAPPSVPWLILSDSPPGWRWGIAIEAGAAAVLPLSTRVDGLLDAIRAAAQGRPAMSEDVRDRVVQDWRRAPDEQRLAALRVQRLTPRETAVLEMLHRGRSVHEIALESGVLDSTVRSQVKRLRANLGVESQLAAVAEYRYALGLSPHRRQDS